MIRSFGSQTTERLWGRERVPSLDRPILRVALRKLRKVGSANVLDDLQSHYELDRAEDIAGERIAAIKPLEVA